MRETNERTSRGREMKDFWHEQRESNDGNLPFFVQLLKVKAFKPWNMKRFADDVTVRDTAEMLRLPNERNLFHFKAKINANSRCKECK